MGKIPENESIIQSFSLSSRHVAVVQCQIGLWLLYHLCDAAQKLTEVFILQRKI
jgi:hypothetical protein